MTALRIAATGLVCAATLTACSGDEDDAFDCHVMPVCDAARSDCQARVFSATACAREQTGASMPPIRTITAQEFATELRQSIEAEPNAQPDPWEQAAKLLGLSPPELPLSDVLVDDLVSNVVAFYDPETKRVSLIAEHAGDAESATFVLSHEFVHALQDQASDLTAFHDQATSTDQSVAIDTLVEGEAMIHPNMLIVRGAKRRPETIDWDSYVSGLQSSAFEAIDGSQAPFFTAMNGLPYSVGFRFLIGPWLDGGQRAINALFETPLLSFGQWAFATGPDRLRPADPLTCFPTGAPSGFTGFDHDRLGVVGLMGLRMTFGEPASTAFGLASALGDDSFVVFSTPDPARGVAVAWRLRFDIASRASSFADAVLGAFVGVVSVQTLERDVLIRAASDASVLATWTNASDCGRAEDLPAPPSQAGATSALRARLPGARTRASTRTSRSR